jgi:hypothetical protein
MTQLNAPKVRWKPGASLSLAFELLDRLDFSNQASTPSAVPKRQKQNAATGEAGFCLGRQIGMRQSANHA